LMNRSRPIFQHLQPHVFPPASCNCQICNCSKG
jgi:hypothetical protein